MTTFDLNNKKTSEIIVKDRILSSDYEKDLINKMIKQYTVTVYLLYDKC